jgi:hypothetical protein
MVAPTKRYLVAGIVDAAFISSPRLLKGKPQI